MSDATKTGWQEASVEGEGGEQITFRRSDQPGALVEVTLGTYEIIVKPAALLAAAKLVQPEEEEHEHRN
jgi:hypothetical protein